MRLRCPIIDKDDARDSLSLIANAVDDVSDHKLECDAENNAIWHHLYAMWQLCPYSEPC